MKRLISVATAGALAIAVAFTTPAAAQVNDTLDKTFLTFSNAVELPGTTLPAGTYVFKLADTPTRDVVQVWNEGETEMLGHWLYIPAERQEATDETVITFRETAAGSTPAVQSWFYPGERTGKEFLYPRDQAMQIAQRTGATVMTDEGPVTGEASASADAAGAEAQANADIAARETEQATDTQGAVGTSGQQPPTYAQGQYAQNELPRTASPLPWSAVIALLSLAGAAGLRAFRS